jgi:hypothetical protein
LTDKIGDGLEKAAAKLAELHRKGRTADELTAVDDYRITSLLLDEHPGSGSCVPFEIIDAVLHQSEETFKLTLRLSNLLSESWLPFKLYDASRPGASLLRLFFYSTVLCSTPSTTESLLFYEPFDPPLVMQPPDLFGGNVA